MSGLRTYLAGILLCCAAAMPAVAQYPRVSESDVDPTIFKIDEQNVLGAKVEGDYALVAADGRELVLGDMLGQPLILVLSYYTCDGSCSLINTDLRNQLKGTEGLEPGKDYRILTLSFDDHDTLKETGEFQRHLELTTDLGANWTFATFKTPEDIKRLTEKVGYKFFWSPRDRTFFHPGVFLVLSGEGRLVRVLYALNTESKDIELAVQDAKLGKVGASPREILNYAVSLCYSYNYKEGRYTFNIPLFVAAASLTLGVAALSVGALVFRRRKSKEEV